jgi:hypothetical protein
MEEGRAVPGQVIPRGRPAPKFGDNLKAAKVSENPIRRGLAQIAVKKTLDIASYML